MYSSYQKILTQDTFFCDFTECQQKIDEIELLLQKGSEVENARNEVIHHQNSKKSTQTHPGFFEKMFFHFQSFLVSNAVDRFKIGSEIASLLFF